MPSGGFDQTELNKEIARIESLDIPRRPGDVILPMLKFIRHARTLDGFLCFPSREWWKRGVDFVKVIPELAAACFTLDHSTAIAKILTTYAGQMFVEMTARGDRKEALKRSGLYYLLKLRAFQEERR
jgi:hypothetical protein